MATAATLTAELEAAGVPTHRPAIEQAAAASGLTALVARPFSVCGKQVLCGHAHYADAKDAHTAFKIAQALNLCAVPTDELADLFSDAMSDVHDMDTGIRDFAVAAASALAVEAEQIGTDMREVS